jgi:2-methylisocitrate lyase-like PEP mutase family enzyme
MTPHVDALRALIRPDAQGRRRCLAVPGCWDGLTALLIEQAGFEAAFLTGGGLAMGRFGRPDMGLVSVTEVAETIAVIRDRIGLPLLVDADTGFGNALNAARTVRLFERAGASAIQLEDQTFPKRCGHMAGKGVIPRDEMVGKLKAALDARSDTLIIARTDAIAVEGFEAAMERAEAYLDAGADILFIEGPPELAQMQAIQARFSARVPLVHNLVEGGVTAVRDGAALDALGYAIALHPLALLHAFAKAGPPVLEALKERRTTDGLALPDLKQMNEIVGIAALSAQAARYG